MNCAEFEAIVVDLARGGPAPAGARQHAAECPRCAARLEAQRDVSAGLAALRSVDAGRSATPAVEAALLAALRGRKKALWRRPAVWAGVGAAAAAVVLVAVNWPKLSETDPAAPPVAVRVVAPAAPPAAVVHQAPPAPPVQRASAKRRTPPPRRPAETALRARAAEASEKAAEKATEFFPLPYGAPVASDWGRVVRVSLPRSAVSAFGLPVAPERWTERIQADVVLGEDGMAHAIRFVRPAGYSSQNYR